MTSFSDRQRRRLKGKSGTHIGPSVVRNAPREILLTTAQKVLGITNLSGIGPMLDLIPSPQLGQGHTEGHDLNRP